MQAAVAEAGGYSIAKGRGQRRRREGGRRRGRRQCQTRRPPPTQRPGHQRRGPSVRRRPQHEAGRGGGRRGGLRGGREAEELEDAHCLSSRPRRAILRVPTRRPVPEPPILRAPGKVDAGRLAHRTRPRRLRPPWEGARRPCPVSKSGGIDFS